MSDTTDTAETPVSPAPTGDLTPVEVSTRDDLIARLKTALPGAWGALVAILASYAAAHLAGHPLLLSLLRFAGRSDVAATVTLVVAPVLVAAFTWLWHLVFTRLNGIAPAWVIQAALGSTKTAMYKATEPYVVAPLPAPADDPSNTASIEPGVNPDFAGQTDPAASTGDTATDGTTATTADVAAQTLTITAADGTVVGTIPANTVTPPAK